MKKTVYTKKLAKKHFGVKSSFYLDMVLNEAYLRRQDYAQCAQLMEEMVKNSSGLLIIKTICKLPK